jgi:hypothetical protein
MVIPALAKPWQDLKRAYAGSSLARFVEWWLGELKQLVPRRFRDALVDPPEELEVRLEPGIVSIWREGRRAALLVLPDEQEPAARQADIARCFARFPGAAQPVVPLPSGRVLRRRLSLPLAAQEKLRQVLGFELDRRRHSARTRSTTTAAWRRWTRSRARSPWSSCSRCAPSWTASWRASRRPGSRSIAWTPGGDDGARWA